MPIYEYVCEACGHEFEALIRGNREPVCIQCGSAKLMRRFSLPAVKSESTHAQAMRDAKKRDRVQGRERVNEQRNYEKNHD